MRGTFLGVPVIWIIIFWSLGCGPPVFGKPPSRGLQRRIYDDRLCSLQKPKVLFANTITSFNQKPCPELSKDPWTHALNSKSEPVRPLSILGR